MSMNSTAARASSNRPLRFIIIGAGPAGILAAIRLTQAGFQDVVIYEKAHRLGGTWRDNTYPGVACDVPAHLYCYSFEPNPEWSRRFAPGAEILAYLDDVAHRYGVARRIRYAEEVTHCEYLDGRWRIETKSGAWDTADVVIAATGVTHHPRLPRVPGLDVFAGPAFHSARWDHSISLDDRRIGVIGTGSTAVQIVAALSERVAQLSLFQRTAQWIMPQENPVYSAEERALFRRAPDKMHSMRAEFARAFVEGFSDAVVDADSPQLKIIEDVCLAHLESHVVDPALRERLRPTYRAACKRLVISNDFYPAMQRPNVQLVTEAIGSIERDGVRTRDGRLHEIDVLVFATGFHTDRFVRPMEVVGPEGVRLSARWAQRPFAYLSVAVPDFPNFFLLNGPNGPVGNYSLIDVAETQMAYVLQLIDLLYSGRCREISPTEHATTRLESERVAATAKTVWTTGCRSWYLDDRGVPASWPWSMQRFRDVMQTPTLEAFELA
jgi:cation diffusion facilitator CzcD-associated flavoprotein CzcO